MMKLFLKCLEYLQENTRVQSCRPEVLKTVVGLTLACTFKILFYFKLNLSLKKFLLTFS